MSPTADTPLPARPLAELTAGMLTAPASLLVSDVTLDSRAVMPGALFLACRGRTHHGLKFAPEALARGAGARLYEPEDAGALPAAGPGAFLAALPGLESRAGVIADRF